MKLTVSDGKGGTATRDIPVAGAGRGRHQREAAGAGVLQDRRASATTRSRRAIAAIQALGTEKNWQVDATEDASLFTDAVLSHYDVVIFISTTGDFLNDTQQAAFERFIRSGKGYVGIHAAADAEYDWRWYGQLVGAYFRNHPDGTPTATVVARGHDGPVHGRASGPLEPHGRVVQLQVAGRTVVNGGTTTARATPSGVHVLLTMDESTYAENDGIGRRRRRSPDLVVPEVTTAAARGTRASATRRPRSREAGIRSHIAAGIEIAAGVLPSAACGVAPTANADPVITAATADATHGVAPLPVTFAATATDADGDTLTYAWDLNGDGTFETNGQNPTFTYTTAGTLHAGGQGHGRARAARPPRRSTAITVTAAGNGTDVPVDVGRHRAQRARR